MDYAEQRYKDGLECARKATIFDQQGDYDAALAFYSEAAEALNQACDMAPLFTPILPRVEEYMKRAREIRDYLHTGGVSTASKPVKNPRDRHAMHQLEYLLEMALMLDEEKRYKEAEKTYTSAVELAIKVQKLLSDDSDKTKVSSITELAIGRLEDIQSLKQAQHKIHTLPEPPKHLPKLKDSDSDGDSEDDSDKKSRVKRKHPQLPKMPLASFLDSDPDKVNKFDAYSNPSTSSGRDTKGGGASPGPSRSSGRKGDKFTDKEIKILRTNSKINGVLYLPWSDTDLSDLRTVSALPMDFIDPDGLPPLAEKQKARLAGWLRPGEICENPKMAHLISSLSIKQTIIGDCSFLASLGVCADYEKRYKKRLITSCIFPQNRHGDPIINPNGKYFIRLNLNGCKRKIVIDDRLPVDGYGHLLCSYSNLRDEFWVSLLEKAYMKVMGGYDFPGSSSNNDLHALTGWIPERIDLKEKDCDKEKTFRMMENKLKTGSALITMGTGPLKDGESERSGLVPTHAYAVLRVVIIHGQKLVQLKNPWSEKRWKGNFSEKDTTNWTPELKRALNYDQSQAIQNDNGVFWIDWASVCHYYDTLYMNWNPDMFYHKYTLHDFWKPGEVEKDLYNISNNPQYTLQVNCTEERATVWILLSRHITTKSDFAKNEKFITLHVVKSNGRRLYLPPKTYVHCGVKINTPHYLVKLSNLPRGTHIYTVVVSQLQLENLSTIYYTIKVYGTCPFIFNPVPSIYDHIKELKGQWKAGHPKPTFKLTLPSLTNVMFQLKGQRKYYVWLSMRSSTPGVLQRETEAARNGFNVLEVANVPPGDYMVTVGTYSEGQEGPFFLTTFTDKAFNFESM